MGYVNQSAEKKNIDREIPMRSEIRIRGHPANRSAKFPDPINKLWTLKVRTGF